MRVVVVGIVLLGCVGAWIVLGGDVVPPDGAEVVASRPVVEAPAPGAAPLVVESVSAEPERLDGPERRRPDAARRARPPAFLVVDATTRERIRRGTLLATTRNAAWQLGEHARGRLSPPRSYDRRIVDGAVFPDSLSLGARQQVLWVTAPGYAWTEHVRSRGDDVVELVPAGRLAVSFTPTSDACAQGQLSVSLSRDGRAYRTDGESGTNDARLTDRLRYGRLPAGTYDLTVHASTRPQLGTLLYSATIDVAPHRVTSHVAALGSATASRLELVVVSAPDSSPASSYMVHFRDEDRDRLIEGIRLEHASTDDEAARFSASCLRPGRYRVQVAELGLSRTIVLLPGETTTLTVDTTGSATVTAHLTGCHERSHPAILTWGFVDDPGTRFTDFVMSASSSKTWSVPPRPTWIQVTGMETASDTVVVAPLPGEELEVDIGCAPGRSATAVLHYVWSPNAPRPQSSEFGAITRADPIGHDGRVRFISQSDQTSDAFTTVTYVFDRPGRYALTYAATWEDTRTIEIEAGPGEREPVVLELGSE